MFAPKNGNSQLAYAYDQRALKEALAELGLIPTPVPTRPFSVELPDGRTLDVRDEFIGGAMDEEGSDRTVLFVHP